MRRSVRGGSVKVGGKVGGTQAVYSEHMKENGGEIGRSLHDFDIKMLQQKRQVSFFGSRRAALLRGCGVDSSLEPLVCILRPLTLSIDRLKQAEMKRNQREEDLRENHPYFDTPLLIVGRESKFRKLCQRIVYARYDPRFRDPATGQERKIKYKTVQ